MTIATPNIPRGVVGFLNTYNAINVCTAALAVPDTLCDNGDVCLICKNDAKLIKNPNIPAAIVIPQK